MRDRVFLRSGQRVSSSRGVWYQCLMRLGSGGNAATFLVVATSGRLEGVPFAMKVFEQLARPERRQDFLREVSFLKSCDHACIMRLFDEGVVLSWHPFLVAEYLPRTLKKVIAEGRVDLVPKLSYASQLMSALSYLASRNPPVVHRDIKPANIFLKGHSCVLGDFGLLKTLTAASSDDREALKISLGAGMPKNYRTPDLVNYFRGGGLPSVKSDVFQAGLVLAELFTGKNPQRPARDVTEDVVLDELRPIPGPLRDLIHDLLTKMLKRSPTERPSAKRLLRAWHGLMMRGLSHALARRERPF